MGAEPAAPQVREAGGDHLAEPAADPARRALVPAAAHPWPRGGDAVGAECLGAARRTSSCVSVVFASRASCLLLA